MRRPETVLMLINDVIVVEMFHYEMKGVYKLRILAVGDCLTDVSTILVFVCKNRVSLAEFQHIDGSARWLTSFNYNHTPHAGTLPSTGHC